MATGPEHYRTAEEILAGEVLPWATDEQNLAAAQVHATLAFAAAIGIAMPAENMPDADISSWLNVASKVRAGTADGGKP